MKTDARAIVLLLVGMAALVAVGLAASALAGATSYATAGRAAAQAAAVFPRGAQVEPGITVTGSGEARAAPDIAHLNLGVQTQAATAEAALRDNNAKMKAVIDSLTSAGVAARDMQTFGLSIRPLEEQRTPGSVQPAGRPPQVLAYRVDNSLAVTIREIDKVGQVVDGAVRAGANASGGVRFAVKEPGALHDQALKQALDAARAEAQAIATGLGLGLGPAISVSEEGEPRGPVPMAGVAAAPAQAADGVPIATGELTVHVRVRAVFAIL